MIVMMMMMIMVVMVVLEIPKAHITRLRYPCTPQYLWMKIPVRHHSAPNITTNVVVEIMTTATVNSVNVSLTEQERSVFNQTNTGNVSRATLKRLLRDGAERVWAFPSTTMPPYAETETETTTLVQMIGAVGATTTATAAVIAVVATAGMVVGG